MRRLVSLEGPQEGGTRGALGKLAFDELHVLATDPDADHVGRVRHLAESLGATITVDSVPGDDLQAAFEGVREQIADADVECQVNAGRHSNLLSAAGLLACLHEGVPAHFVHEEGYTPLPVLTRAPLKELLDDEQREVLTDVPADGLDLDDVDEDWAAVLNRLKDRDLVATDEDRVTLTRLGASYREHVLRRVGYA
jgi:hypothetical protein